MRAVTRAMLDDMPDPCDLHLERSAGRCLVMVGSAVLSEYAGSNVDDAELRGHDDAAGRVQGEAGGGGVRPVGAVRAGAARGGAAGRLAGAGVGRAPCR